MISAGGYILKPFIRTSVFVTGRLTLSQSSPPVRNATYLRTLFLELFVSFARFCQPACIFAARFTLRQPKTPVRNATNFWIIMPFKRFFVLWHSLIRSLYVIQVYMKFFILLINSAPFFRFLFILLYTNFFLCILLREIFFLFLMTLLPGILLFLISAVKGLIWTRFSF